MVITGFRIQALHKINAADFTYARGYLGLLSALGALTGIIACYTLSLRSALFRRPPDPGRFQLDETPPDSQFSEE